jgi:hypothetical protein
MQYIVWKRCDSSSRLIGRERKDAMLLEPEPATSCVAHPNALRTLLYDLPKSLGY